MKYPPLLLKNLAKLIVGDNTPNRLTGKDLVDFFNEFNFEDDYVYSNGGITTIDIGTALSRTDYARKRLALLNDKEQIDAAIAVYLQNCEDKPFAEDAIIKVLGKAPGVTTQTPTIDSSAFQPKSQFEDIPTNVPVVFISYSWDDDEHIAWVRKLSDDLRSKHSVYTLLDKYNTGGANLVEFMDRGLQIAHRVLMIGTPNYKHKSERGYGTGGKYEGSIINAWIYHNTETLKFIPLLRKGNAFKDSFSAIISCLNGYDFRDDNLYEKNLKDLADDLRGRNAKAPALGSAVMEDFESEKEIHAEYKSERWLFELLKHFSFYLMDDYFYRMPCRFDTRVITMFDFWNGIINSSVYHINNEELRQRINEFYQPWKNICEFGGKYYSPSNNGTDYVFYGAEFDMFNDPEKEMAFERVKDMIVALYPKYKAFVEFLDNNYPQIDREKISIDFVKMLQHQEDILKQ